MYDKTKSASVQYILLEYIKKIQSSLGIDWPSTTWEDCRKPLYSALGMRLYLTYESRAGTGIPRPIDEQADFWIQYYRPGEDRNTFITAANQLEQGNKWLPDNSAHNEYTES